MPRPAKPPRLYLRERAGRESIYVILDRGREVGTGCGPNQAGDAEKAFQRYLAEKHKPQWRNGDPSAVPVADMLTTYTDEVAPTHAHPELVDYHVGPLLDHFGLLTCWQIDEGACRAYVAARIAGLAGRKPVAQGTAKRELETLAAALNFAYKAHKIVRPVFVWRPEKSSPRERWLTRDEVAALVRGALGFKLCGRTESGRARWRRDGRRPSYHVARFILIALYTGTRHEAVLRLRWGVNSDGGWFDLDHGRLYRRGQGEAETKKRRTPAPIPGRLLPHLKRWKRLTVVGPCEYNGELIKREKRGWARARALAGLGPEVIPHSLRHTCATWMLQHGVSTWEVAGYLGASEQMIRNTYGHHASDFLANAAGSFRGRNLGASPGKRG